MTKKAAAAKAIEITDWSQAEAAMRELGLRQISVASSEGLMNIRISQAKADAESLSAVDRQEIAALEEALEMFWLANRAGVAAKSCRLTFGVMGTRGSRAVRILRGWTVPKVVHALGHGLANYLRPRDPELDRERILQAPPADLDLLKTCGVAIEEREKFFVEPDLEKLRSAGE